MRIRTIKPGFWANDEIAALQPMARLLFIGLWGMADVRGRLEDRPKRIKAVLLPYDDCDVDELLDEIASAGFIVRYSVDEARCIQVVNFEKHQRINGKEAETESEIPGTDHENARVTTGKHRGSTREATGKQSGSQEGKGREGNEEGKGEDSRASRGRFAPPTREELDLEAAKIGLPAVEVDKFVAYYGSNGWRVGKSPMKSWPHALAGWAARWREREANPRNGHARPLIGTATPPDAEF